MAEKDDKPALEETRSHFAALVAENPNYFGNLEDSPFKPKKKIIASQRYEALTCIGLNPDLDLLEATIQVKLPYGYGGTLCRKGSYEYVRFFLSYDGGLSWEDAGLVAVNVHDIPDRDDCADRPTKPLSFVLTQQIKPRRNFCKWPVLPQVRAILPWEWIPPAGNPKWLPVWGKRLDRHVQIRHRELQIADFPGLVATDLTLPVELEIDPALGRPSQPDVAAHRYGAGAALRRLVARYEPPARDAGLRLRRSPARVGSLDSQQWTRPQL